MYDIKFIQDVTAFKERLVAGEMTRQDVVGIERELDRLRSRVPHVFNIETTNHCNMTCIMCPRTTLMTRGIEWINENAFDQVLDQIKPHETEALDKFWSFIKDYYGITFDHRGENAFYFYIVSRCVILHGYGEPLVDRNIVDRVQACTDRGIPTYFSCVPANITVKRAERVMKAGLSVLKFSIDSLTDEKQKEIRGRHNNFESAYRTMLDVIEMRDREGYKTIIVPTMIALSEDDESREMHEQFLRLWKDHDVFAYVKSQDNRWYFEDDAEMQNRSHYQKQYCEYPWTSLTVMADGSVVPCTQDYDCEMAQGNIYDQSLEEIWNGENYQNLRRWHITGDFPAGHKCAERCDQVKLFSRLKSASN